MPDIITISGRDAIGGIYIRPVTYGGVKTWIVLEVTEIDWSLIKIKRDNFLL